MFTPQEVSEKVFPKASFGSGGYSMSSVDEFLDALTEDYSTLFKENVTLKAKLKVLAEKVEEYRSTEDAMRQTLLTAQKMAAKLVQEAQAEKDRMLSGAKAEAAQEIQRLESEKQAAQQKLAMAQEKLAEFIRRSDELCQAQSAFLQTLPELELVPAAAETAEKPDAVVGAIEQDILTQYDAAPEEKAEETKPAVTDEPTIQFPPVNDNAVPTDFKLSLDELKFGRNYNGGKSDAQSKKAACGRLFSEWTPAGNTGKGPQKTAGRAEMCGGAQRRRRWAAPKCAAGRRQRAAAVRDSRSSNGPVRRWRGRAAAIPAGRGLWPRQRRMAAPARPRGQTRRRADDGQAYHRAAVRFRQDAVYHRYGGLRLYPRAGVHPRPVLGQGQHLRA